MPLHRLEHVLVLTDDLAATRAFYCDVLGFEAGERPPLEFPGHWLYLDGVACVHVAERAAYEAHAAQLGLSATPSPVDHVAFAADGYGELAERLDAAGIEAVANAVPGAGLRQLFLTDPNGARVELNFAQGRAKIPEAGRFAAGGLLFTQRLWRLRRPRAEPSRGSGRRPSPRS